MNLANHELFASPIFKDKNVSYSPKYSSPIFKDTPRKYLAYALTVAYLKDKIKLTR